jgi:hypothetical protein
MSTTRITLTHSELSTIQDALYYHYLNDEQNVSTEEDEWELEQLESTRAKIDRAYERLEP